MTTGNPDYDDGIALAAEYALGLLTPPEERAFESRLPVDPAFRALFVTWAEDFVTLTDAIAPVTPPKSVLTAINARLFPDVQQSWWQRIGLVPSLLGGLVAALLVVAVGYFGILQPDGPVGPTLTAQITAADQSLIVAASFNPADGTLQVDRTTGAARDGRVLELWLIAGDNPPVSLGVLPDTQLALVVIDPALVASLAGGTLAISDEPPGGSTTGAPTGDVLATGQVTTL